MDRRVGERSTVELDRFAEEIIRRNALYLEHGFDREKAASFVVDSAGDIRPPILDIGSGRGAAAVEMARRGLPLLSVDISEEEIDRAVLYARYAGVESLIGFLVADANLLPFDGGRFNFISMINVLHHLGDYSGIMSEVSRVLAPGGTLLLADLTDEGFEILDRVHVSEGRTHSKHNGSGMDEVAAELNDFGIQCTGRDIRFHQHVMVSRRI